MLTVTERWLKSGSVNADSARPEGMPPVASIQPEIFQQDITVMPSQSARSAIKEMSAWSRENAPSGLDTCLQQAGNLTILPVHHNAHSISGRVSIVLPITFTHRSLLNFAGSPFGQAIQELDTGWNLIGSQLFPAVSPQVLVGNVGSFPGNNKGPWATLPTWRLAQQ